MRRTAALLVLVAGCTSYEHAPPPVTCEAPGFALRPEAARWPAEGTGPVNALRPQDQPEPSRLPTLKAGQLDDNDRFDEFLHYRDHVEKRVQGRVHEIDVSERVTLRIVDAASRPVPGAKVIVRDASGQPVSRRTTYADGRALFFPRAEASAQDEEWVVDVSLGDLHARKVVTRGEDAVTLRLDGERDQGRPALDVVFCLDCTGSMGDEIDRLKQTIGDVANRLAKLPGSPRVRLGLVRYKDRCDEYVVARDDLTADLGTFRRALAKAEAGGGGDYPEDVQAGLAAAIDAPSWSRSPDAARLVFLIGDAPPHLDYTDEQDYPTTLRHAAERGVKICTLAASGLDDAGEYIWRQLAEATLGRFIFISYAVPGGGRGTPHHTGPYLENDLDDIVVKQCARELEALQAGPVNEQR